VSGPITVTEDRTILEVRGLTTRFPVKGGFFRRTVAMVHAVEDVSFAIRKGETLSLVGESGCGKSTCGRSILRLVEPLSGHVHLDGEDVIAMSAGALRRARRQMQMVFQDPFASLNPQMQLADQVAEPLRNFGLASGEALRERVGELFDRVHLPRSFMRRYPHELSGGQRQRIAIARALALNPKLIIADEAVSALDVSVQAQVLELLDDVRDRFDLAMLFITHDLRVAAQVCDRIMVMRRGEVVEEGPTARVYADPQHDYPRALLAAAPGTGRLRA
jgi:peptide/nickel transport system ATP-binding protein/glutathione transport system ATP-binding protein